MTLESASGGSVRDVVVVGGGPVGCALALALADSGLRVEVLDARAAGGTPRDERTLALSHGARLILERAGVWSELATSGRITDIRIVDVSQRGGFGCVRLDAAEQGLPALGYVVGYRALQSAFDARMARAGVAIRFAMRVDRVRPTPAYASVELASTGEAPRVARLVVVADGAGASFPGLHWYAHDYRQSALTAWVELDAAHAGVAYERFTPDGPAALLPGPDAHALVWTVDAARVEALAALPDARFLAELQRHFGERVRGFRRVRDRRAFALALRFATRVAGRRTVLIGNAAQTLHPVAGQGFNLGLRDAFELARIVLDTPCERIGDHAMLERYARGRRLDRYAGIGFTHALSGLFAVQSAPLVLARGAALGLLDALAPLKRSFTRAMLFGVH